MFQDFTWINTYTNVNNTTTIKNFLKARYGGTCLKSQQLRQRGKMIMGSRPAGAKLARP
jgi:starvation-inducible outer membrane lipoprotein